MADFLKGFLSVAIGLLFLAAIVGSCAPKDDTDSADGRSGMYPHTDAKTGCQYLSKGSSLTPRLDASGKQICGVKKP